MTAQTGTSIGGTEKPIRPLSRPRQYSVISSSRGAVWPAGFASLQAPPSLTSAPQASTTPRMHIRLFAPADLPALHAINVAGEPGVGAVSAQRLGETIGMGTCLVAETDGQIAGFLLLLPPETEYDSKNYQWFDERYEDYVYVDRIAIAASARGKGVGTALYLSLIHI